MNVFPQVLLSVSRLVCLMVVAAMTAHPTRVGAAAPPQLEAVVVVFKTHFDIGYTDMASNVVQRYRTTMIDQALEVVDQNRALPPDRQFVWTLPGWPLRQIVADWPGQSDARRQRVNTAFREGRFVVHALPFTTHTELLEPEDLVRGLGYSSRLCRDAGLELPRDAKMTDVPCHSWILPTLLRHAGVGFLHLGCNAASSSPRVPILFWWEGPDRSRLLTMYTAESYGTGLVPPADWPHKTWLALIHTGDNHGPPRPDEVKTLLEEAAVKLPGVRVRIGRLSDFSDAILAEKAELPVVRGDMPDTWIHGPMCDPDGARLARTIRPAIAIRETLDTHLRSWIGGDRSSEIGDGVGIAAAYEKSLLYGEHTWGGAYWWIYGKYIQHYGDKWRQERGAGRFTRIESSWAEHTGYIEEAARLTQPALEDQMRALARAVDLEGLRFVVFNPLPWPRDGVVELPDAMTAGFNTIRSADDGPAQMFTEWGQGVRRFVARSVPPSGYRTYRLSHAPSAKPPRPNPIESPARILETPDMWSSNQASGAPLTSGFNDSTERGAGERAGNALGTVDEAADRKLPEARLASRFFRATLDPERGVIRSLVDRQSRRELVDATAPHGFGQYLYERFSSNEVQAYVNAYVKINSDWAANELGKPNLPPASEVPYRASSPRNWGLTIERTRAAQTATLAAPATTDLPAVTTRLILYQEQPCADIELTVHDKPSDPWPEAGWLCLPFNIEQPRFRLGRLGAIIDPVHEIVPGANRNLYGLDTGLTMAEPGGWGVGLCALDNPLVSLDSPGCWKYSLDFVPRRPAVYVNLFNNQWTTNFRLWNSGTWTARVRVWSVKEAGNMADALIAPSLEARFPLQVAWADGPGGPLPARQAGLGVELAGVRVTAFGPNPDGPGTVLRLWEYAGRGGRCGVRLPPGMDPRFVQPVDLRGRPLGAPLPVRARMFHLEMKPFAPASVVIR